MPIRIDTLSGSTILCRRMHGTLSCILFVCLLLSVQISS